MKPINELPLGGHYYGMSPAFRVHTFLKLYPDAFWIIIDYLDPIFDCSAYLRTLDLADLKQRFPLGVCLHNEQRFRNSFGRFTRVSDAPVRNGSGQVVGKYGDALVLWSWNLEEGAFQRSLLEIVGPGHLRDGMMIVDLEFVPDPRIVAEPARCT